MSEALRNLALDHASSDPFRKHYLGREVTGDLWAVIRGQRQQQALLKQACSVGHSISKRRPVDLTSEQAASINFHPRILKLAAKLDKLECGSEDYQRLRLTLRSEKQALKRALKKHIRRKWTDEQAVRDIELQLQGHKFPKHVAADQSDLLQRPAQKRLIEALLAPVSNNLKEQLQRRTNAITAIVAYCKVQECSITPTNDACADGVPNSTTLPSKLCHDPQEDSPLFKALLSVFVDNRKQRPRRCFLCVGVALSLASDDPGIENYIHEFYTSGALTKHFRRRHLSQLAADSNSECKVCKLPLQHKMHLQSHAELVHGTLS